MMKAGNTFHLTPTTRDAFFDQLMQSLGRFSCQGDTRYSRRILEAIHGLDVENTLAEFASMGKVCDCDILFNMGVNCWNERSNHHG